MKYKKEEPHNPDHALMTAVTSAFRAINPSYENTYAWYTQKNRSKLITSPVLKSTRSKYYIPLFGSAFASALALVMILTSQNNLLQEGNMAFNTRSVQNSGENGDVAAFSAMSAKTVPVKTDEKHVLAKIDAQSKSASRTQADESFTESLNTETSLKDLFE